MPCSNPNGCPTDADGNLPLDHYTADVVSATDYYPFGLSMPERKFSSDSYRYGFNGKEKDKDMQDQTVYDYGFRIYNPALSKFLSVDPLTQSYPSFSPYHFAGNNPIKFIDLDGLEIVDPAIVIQEPKSKGEPGLAYTTVRKVYYVVTTGLGALTKREQSEINVSSVNNQLNSTPTEVPYYTELPTTKSRGQYLGFDNSQYRKLQSNNKTKISEVLEKQSDPSYMLEVGFDVDIIVVPDMSLEDIAKKVALDPAKYGVIFNSFDISKLSTISISSTLQDLITNADEQFKRHEGSEKGEAEAYGSIVTQKNRGGLDVIIFNTKNTNVSLSMTNRLIHEIGHNFTNKAHGSNYDYLDKGLQSNSNPRPSADNKKDIISTNETRNIYDKVIFNNDTRS